MKAHVIVFPGSNCDRDVAVSLEQAMGAAPEMLWHGETEVPATDLIVLPGGFSYGDYLRCGAMAAHSPIMRDVVAKANAGTRVLGICNGFQVLTESGLLPGVLMQNMSLKYICRDVQIRVERTDTDFTRKYGNGGVLRIPIAHHEGNYNADEDTLDRLEGEGRWPSAIAHQTARRAEANPNGSARNIAGHLQRRRHRARPDAASRTPGGPATGRHRRRGHVLVSGRGPAMSAAAAAEITPDLVAEHGLSPTNMTASAPSWSASPTSPNSASSRSCGREHCSYKSSRVWLKDFPTEGPR